MEISYNEELKELPNNKLHRLFRLVGWSDGSGTEEMLDNFNLPFKNSTLVISAWDDDKLIGTVRVLSDKVVRSSILDLVVDPEYQGQGIGSNLVKRCIAHYPKSEWLVATKEKISPYYENLGFKKKDSEEVFLSIPSQWF